MGAYIRANVQGVGLYYADDANTLGIPSYAILNVGIGVDRLDFANDRLYLNAFFGVNNLGDAKYVASAWLNPDLNTKNLPMFLEPGLPRSVLGSISLGWNL